MTEHKKFMKMAIDLAKENILGPVGGPFGAVIVRNGVVIGKGVNKVTANHDPTAHAEVEAIRDACKNLGTFQLDGCVIYSSCEPCPMCLGAIYWARPDAIYYASDREDAASAEFDDSFIYLEITKDPSSRKIPTRQIMRKESLEIFDEWMKKSNKKKY
ncbi:MAG TPA: nucleoside deaminase [Saprospiraceae bacterium]|nr:tRNA-specific adenosine deaminase [Saprospirales bacterium]HRQ31271.1 nucleoside deaminase [Saprospiraceae bacterium]